MFFLYGLIFFTDVFEREGLLFGIIDSHTLNHQLIQFNNKTHEVCDIYTGVYLNVMGLFRGCFFSFF